MSGQEGSSSILQLREAIDAVLIPRGFAAGQVGTVESRGQLIWCAAPDDFAVRFPALPPSREPSDGWGTMCTDLVVDIALDQAIWTVSGVRLEADDLADVLSRQGSETAHLAAALLGAPIADCLTPLPSLLAELLRDTSAEP